MPATNIAARARSVDCIACGAQTTIVVSDATDRKDIPGTLKCGRCGILNAIAGTDDTTGSSAYGTPDPDKFTVTGVNLKDGASKATQTLTSDATNVSNNDTVTIGSTVYTFKTTLSTGPTVPFEVLIGADAATTLDNLKLAINAGAGAGTNYSTGTTAHPTVTATTNTDTTQVVEAITAGTAGNSIASTKSAAHLSWGAATLTGGDTGITTIGTPSGSDFYPLYVLVRIASQSGFTTAGAISVGTDASVSDVKTAQTLTGLDAIEKTGLYEVTSSPRVAPSTAIKVKVTTEAAATTLTADITVVGYYSEE